MEELFILKINQIPISKILVSQIVLQTWMVVESMLLINPTLLFTVLLFPETQADMVEP